MSSRVVKALQNKKDLSGLSDLYDRIHECEICPNMYREKRKARRREDAVSGDMDVFIISQALARETLFESGVNFFKPDGKLGSTGRNLEPFLNKFGRTIYPRKEVKAKYGTIPACREDLIPVYNTETAQCFPGKLEILGTPKKSKDRIPTDTEVENCLQQKFLLDELKFLRPKLILLMGKVSRDTFFQHYLKVPKFPKNLSDHISSIVFEKKIPAFNILGNRMPIYVLPIQHASGGNAHFYKMLNDNSFNTLVEMIKEVIYDED